MRTAVVTSGASGIGKAVAERLRKDGHRVAVFDLAPSGGEDEYLVDVLHGVFHCACRRSFPTCSTPAGAGS